MTDKLPPMFMPLPGEDMSWQERALCAQTDPEAFFPEKGGQTRDPKRVCLTCDVRDECLKFALDHDERWGIWGGLTERERRKLKRNGDRTAPVNIDDRRRRPAQSAAMRADQEAEAS